MFTPKCERSHRDAHVYILAIRHTRHEVWVELCHHYASFDPPFYVYTIELVLLLGPLIKEEADDRLLLYLAIACAPRPPSRRTRARADAIFHPPLPPVPRVSILLRARTLVSRGLRRGGSLRGSRFPRRGLLSELLGTSIPVSRGACRARERSRRSRA